MRPIKFRVWDKENKRWGSPNILEVWDESGKLEPFSYIKTGKLNPLYQPIENYIIQQFTGLLDINGKEIYEGDIVKDLDKEFGVIEFSNGSFILNTQNRILPFWSVMIHNNMVYPRQMNTNTLEIFGNIFENPELIEKK